MNGKPSSNVYKNQLIKTYKAYCKVNDKECKIRNYTVESKPPIIPSETNLRAVISAANFRYSVIYNILLDSGAEGKELEWATREDIDADQGIIRFKGCKMHNSRNIELLESNKSLLREYLRRYPQEHPFPKSNNYGDNWNRVKKSVAKKLNNAEILKTDVRHLRHFSSSHFYDETKDIIATKDRLGHKKIETTMRYVRSLCANQDGQWISVAVKNDDIEQALKLTTEGFTVNAEMTGYKIFRKRKR
jgi:integrase